MYPMQTLRKKNAVVQGIQWDSDKGHEIVNALTALYPDPWIVNWTHSSAPLHLLSLINRGDLNKTQNVTVKEAQQSCC